MIVNREQLNAAKHLDVIRKQNSNVQLALNFKYFQQKEAGPLVEANSKEPDGDRDHVPALELRCVYR